MGHPHWGGARKNGGVGWATRQEYDDEANLGHTLFRQYSSTQGRWLTPDPAGLAAVDITNPQSWNRYGYVMNNPLILIDLLGLCDEFYWDPVAQWDVCKAYLQGAGGGGSSNFSSIASVGNGRANGGNAGGTLSLSRTGFTLGIRAPNQTFGECMEQHSQDYSAVGAVDALGAAFGEDYNPNLKATTLGAFIGGNHINSIIFGNSGEAALASAHALPDTAAYAMGTAISYGRPQTTLTGLNLLGRAGDAAPVALSQATTAEGIGAIAVKGGVESIGRVLNLGLSVTARIAADVTFTGSEALGCLGPRH